MKRFRSALFYFLFMTLFCTAMFWIVQAGKSLEASKMSHSIVHTDTISSHNIISTLETNVNNPLAILLMMFDIWERDKSLPAETSRNLEVARTAAMQINVAMQEMMGMERYRAVETTLGKVLSVRASEPSRNQV